MTQSIAVVFPGQGSQQVGMLADVAAEHPIIEQTFEEASAALGYDLWQVVQQGPEGRLNSTETTQPALLAAGVALWRLWKEQGGADPAFMAGHSLGEYTALVCAGVMPFGDAVRLVRARGEFMQQAVPAGQGAMAAVLGLDDSAVESACASAAQGDVVAAVNYNSPGQVVIAGSRAAVERAIEACKAAGAKRAVGLPVSVPSHCALMKPAAEQLAGVMDAIHFSEPGIAVVQNTTAAVSPSLELLRSNLLAQLYSPVLWSRSVQYMADQGVTTLLECGPGKVLAGLAKRIDRRLGAVAINESASIQKALQQ